MVHQTLVSATAQPNPPQDAAPALSDPENLKTATDLDQKDVSEESSTSDASSDHKQLGVKQVEAITTVWSKELLIVMFVLLYLVTFVDSLLKAVQDNLSPYVTSSFQQHGLVATTSIISTVLGGVCNLTIAKIIDIWGRCEGFVAMVFLVCVGMITKAVCKNVETYAAAETIYWVGQTGMNYIISVIVSDITSLQNRLILFGINGTPTIASTFAGPKIAELFYTQVNFRWAFGAFLIILVAFCIPVGVIFIISKRKAVRLGVYPERDRSRTWWGATKYYVVQFDVVGMFLTVFGWGLLLLPFSLVYYAPQGWKTPYIIAMIVLGAVLLGLFAIWERFFAPVAYFPFHYLKDRTVLGSCLLYGFMFLSIFCWDAYYGSYLQVVHNQSIADAGYIVNSFGLAAAIIGPLVGYFVHWTGNYKWIALGAVPLSVLGTALLIYFRTPHTGVGWLVMCQVFNGIACGIWPLVGQLAIMASVGHQEIAVGLALWGLFGSVGAAIGLAIAGALWNNVLPEQLLHRLPADAKDQMATIFGDLNVQLGYPMGNPVRDAIIGAYGDVQRKMVIAGAAFTPLCLICVLMLKNINVRNLEATKGKQTKGNVF